MLAFLSSGVSWCDTCGRFITLEEVIRPDLGNDILDCMNKLGWDVDGVKLKCCECKNKEGCHLDTEKRESGTDRDKSKEYLYGIKFSDKEIRSCGYSIEYANQLFRSISRKNNVILVRREVGEWEEVKDGE